jgi:hypothetical protein
MHEFSSEELNRIINGIGDNYTTLEVKLALKLKETNELINKIGNQVGAPTCHYNSEIEHGELLDRMKIIFDMIIQYKQERKPIWTMEEVVRLNEYQRNKNLHPYTCGQRSDHPKFDGDYGVLVATVYGWICPFCDYTSDWDIISNNEKNVQIDEK